MAAPSAAAISSPPSIHDAINAISITKSIKVLYELYEDCIRL